MTRNKKLDDQTNDYLSKIKFMNSALEDYSSNLTKGIPHSILDPSGRLVSLQEELAKEKRITEEELLLRMAHIKELKAELKASKLRKSNDSKYKKKLLAQIAEGAAKAERLFAVQNQHMETQSKEEVKTQELFSKIAKTFGIEVGEELVDGVVLYFPERVEARFENWDLYFQLENGKSFKCGYLDRDSVREALCLVKNEVSSIEPLAGTKFHGKPEFCEYISPKAKKPGIEMEVDWEAKIRRFYTPA